MNFEEKKLILKLYWAGNSHVQVRDTFAGLFPERPIPALSSIQNLIQRFEDTGSINSMCSCERKRGRQLAAAARADESIERLVVLATVADNPSKSTWTIYAETGVEKAKVHRFIRKEGYKSFKKQHHQKLLPGDFFLRMEFCELVSERMWRNPVFTRNICFTDECSYGLTGNSNRQTDRIWAFENPHIVNDDRDQRRAVVNVWLGIVGRSLIGPFFIDGCLNAFKYGQLLQNQIFPAIEDVRPLDQVFTCRTGLRATLHYEIGAF